LEPIGRPAQTFAARDVRRRWISDAQIAETVYTAFAGTLHAVTARLIVRRIRRDDPAQIPGQGVRTPTTYQCSDRPSQAGK
jgi:hypothetical protein